MCAHARAHRHTHTMKITKGKHPHSFFKKYIFKLFSQSCICFILNSASALCALPAIFTDGEALSVERMWSDLKVCFLCTSSLHKKNPFVSKVPFFLALIRPLPTLLQLLFSHSSSSMIYSLACQWAKGLGGWLHFCAHHSLVDSTLLISFSLLWPCITGAFCLCFMTRDGRL